MKPYYQEENITIYNGDCLEVMKDFKDNQFDLCLTDPPYGIGESSFRNISRTKLARSKDYGPYTWDKEKINKDYFLELKRISKNQVIFGGNYYCSILGDTSCFIVWDKDNGKSNFADCELAWTSFKSAVRIFKYRWHGMLQGNMKNKEFRYHPTQKPLPLMKWILNNYSKNDDTILDPFLGSGTTARACKDLGRKCIGIEISQEYCDIAVKRLGQEVLF